MSAETTHKYVEALCKRLRGNQDVTYGFVMAAKAAMRFEPSADTAPADAALIARLCAWFRTFPKDFPPSKKGIGTEACLAIPADVLTEPKEEAGDGLP